MELIVPYLFFILITIIILVVQFFVDSSIRKYIHYGYIFILLTSQITFYSILASNKCKDDITYNQIFNVAFPWLFIIPISAAILEMFPNWITVFSNTIGYLFISLYSLFMNISLESFVPSSKDKSLVSIYINQFSMNNLPQDTGLQDIVMKKETVSTYFWYLLFGSYATVLSNFQFNRIQC